VKDGNVLVTGCTGVTGNALVRYLLAQDLSVTAVIRPSSPRREFLPEHPKLEIVECELGAYKKLLEIQHTPYQAFFHLAWDGSRGKEKTDLRNHMPMQLKNAGHVLEAVEICRALGCPVFLATGSQAEYGSGTGVVDEITACRPENGYGAAKVCAASMASILCKQYGIRFIWARLFSVYGPRDATHSMIDTAVTQLLNGVSPVYTSGEQMWNYLYSSDAAKALSLLAFTETAEGVYCVASQKSRPLKDYIVDLHSVVSQELNPRLGALPSAGNHSARMEVDIHRLIEDTGFYEEYTFQQGVSSVRDWYVRNRRTPDGMTLF